MPRLLVISDIHGHHVALKSLIDWVRPTTGECVITLGDTISGGPSSKRVLDELLRLRQRVSLVPLLGNHEQLMLLAQCDPAAHRKWLLHGGLGILASYRTTSIDEVPALHWHFLRSFRPYYETQEFIFVHATVDPALPMAAQPENKLLKQKLARNLAHISGKTVICGHTPQSNGLPLQLENTICIDTNIKKGGWATCLEPLTGLYWQADQAGRRRCGALAPVPAIAS